MVGSKLVLARSSESGTVIDPESTGEVVHPINSYSEEQEDADGSVTPDKQFGPSVSDSTLQKPVPGSKCTVAVS